MFKSFILINFSLLSVFNYRLELMNKFLSYFEEDWGRYLFCIYFFRVEKFSGVGVMKLFE